MNNYIAKIKDINRIKDCLFFKDILNGKVKTTVVKEDVVEEKESKNVAYENDIEDMIMD